MDLDKNIILYGDNKGQCVDDCQKYYNPYLISSTFFTLKNCTGKNYCLPLNICLNGKFDIDLKNRVCKRLGECNINIFNDTDPFLYDNNR